MRISRGRVINRLHVTTATSEFRWAIPEPPAGIVGSRALAPPWSSRLKIRSTATPATTLASMDQLLLTWFRALGRDLPWRRTRDPYAILVSEVMLQQTQVERVVPRYLAWLERWPTVNELAAASPAEVIREWQGLGYNRRAVNLHRAARQIAVEGWPDDLTELPGVGRYTADAVAAFAFGAPVLPEDTNVRRVQERTGHRFGPEVRAGAHGPRRDGLPGAGSPLRRVPACRRLPVTRPAVRAAAAARAVRGLLQAATGARPAARSRSARFPSTSSTGQPSPRSSATAWWSSRTRAFSFRSTEAARPPAPPGPRRGR